MENQYCNNNNNNNFVSNQDSIDSLIDPYFSKFDIKVRVIKLFLFYFFFYNKYF